MDFLLAIEVNDISPDLLLMWQCTLFGSRVITGRALVEGDLPENRGELSFSFPGHDLLADVVYVFDDLEFHKRTRLGLWLEPWP